MKDARVDHELSYEAGSSVSGYRTTELLVMLLLSLGFFLGPLKLSGTSWVSYLSADGLALLILVIVFGTRVAARKPFFAATPLSLPLLLLGSFCILELVNPEAPFFRSVLGLRSWLLYLGFYFVGFYTFRSVRQLERLYILLIALGFVTAVYGVYQWRAGPDSFASWSDYYGQYARLTWSARSGVVFRAFSTFVLPNTFGSNMALVTLLAFSVTASSTVGVRWRLLAGAAILVMVIGIAASGSRGPVAQLLLAAAVGLPLIRGLWKKTKTTVLAAVLAGGAGALVVFVVGPVVSERFGTLLDPQTIFWKWFGPLSNGLRVGVAHPFGMGLGYTAGLPKFIPNPAFQDLGSMSVDSGYGSAAAELGLMGLGLFCYFALKVGVEGIRSWRRLPAGRLRDLLLGPALLAGTYPIFSIVSQPQAVLPSSIYSWLLIGILVKASSLEHVRNED